MKIGRYRNRDSILVSQASLLLMFVLSQWGCSPSPPAHGTALIVALDTNRVESITQIPEYLERTREVLRKRLDRLGGRYSIEKQADGRLQIKLPQLESNKLDLARRIISTSGMLEFRIVHTNSAALVEQGIIEPGYEILQEERTLADGRRVAATFLVKKNPERGLTGKYIKRAMVIKGQIRGEPEITFELNPEGAKLFEEITTEYQPKGTNYYQLAIVLDGKLHSAPRIIGVIAGGRGVIHGNFEMKEAYDLANVLENPLEVPHRIVEERTF